MAMWLGAIFAKWRFDKSPILGGIFVSGFDRNVRQSSAITAAGLSPGLVLLNVLLATLGWFAGPLLAGPPNFDLVGFATVNGLGRNGTTGGAGGEHVHVSALADLARHLESNQTLMVEILNDIDLSLWPTPTAVSRRLSDRRDSGELA